MFDIFYFKKAPGLFPHEKQVESLESAQQQCRTRYFWIVDYLCDYNEWDFLWEPAPWEAHCMHAWASQHQKDCGTYLVPKNGFTEIKYHQQQILRLACTDNWNKKQQPNWDYSWHPDPTDPPYVYHFGTQHQCTGGMVYTTPGAVEIKFVSQPIEKTTVDQHWHVPDGLDCATFDFTWHPDELDPPYIYKFGTQHQPTGGPEYHSPGATEIKYLDSMQVVKKDIDSHWTVPDGLDDAFDFTWHPNHDDPPFIYQFGTQWQKTGGPTYTVPGASSVKYIDSQKATKTSTDKHWDDLEYPGFDFTWHPDSTEHAFVYQFGTQWQKTGGPRYTVPGAVDIKYVNQPRFNKTSIEDHWVIPDGIDYEDFDFTWHPDLTEGEYVYQFGTQHQKAGGPIYHMPGATNVKYVAAPRVLRTTIDDNWKIPDNVEIENFDYTWHPDPTDPPYIYQFGTQHQKTGGPQYITPGATETKYVTTVAGSVKAFAKGIVVINHANNEVDETQFDLPILLKTRYINDYLGTLKRCLGKLKDVDFVWVISDINDYTDFDFSWHPEQWQCGMLNVFASNEQKFGDTFFVHVPSFMEKANDCELLEWYQTLNFVENVSVPRLPLPTVHYETDSVVPAVWNHYFDHPLALFYKYTVPETYPTVSLWREKTKTVTPLAKGGESVIVPREAKNHIKSQIYDYPWVDKKSQPVVDAQDCDVIFISNNEPMAEQNWQNLLQICPRAKRSDGVTGRELAYKTAAELSDTDWFYAVFAKTEVLDSFRFDFQPDRLQQAKHYIFHSRNPLNGLEYGAMNINLYCKELVLDTKPGLDFTLSQLHDVVPIVASISRFNTDPWITWRSAFREVLKLKLEVDQGAGPVIQHRLTTWCTVAEGENAEYCLQGANDALEYYATVEGSLEQLQHSFDWAWLEDFYFNKYNRKLWLEVE